MNTLDEKALSDLWDQHLAAEFAMKDVERTLATMVPHPSVNHVPVMTGAIGREQVREFYTNIFMPQLPTAWSSSSSRTGRSTASASTGIRPRSSPSSGSSTGPCPCCR
jgi:hypothetical protein